jgi:integrase
MYQGREYGGGGLKTKKEARAVREVKRAQVKAEIAKGSSRNLQPSGYVSTVTSYLQFSQRRHAAKTFQYKKTVYKRFHAYLKDDIPLAEITPAMVTEYLGALQTNAVYNAHRKDLAALFSYAVKVLEIPLDKNPCTAVQKMPRHKRPKKTWTTEEFRTLIFGLTPEEKPLILTLAYTMARIDEILRLKISDVNLTQNFLTLYTRKNKDGSYIDRHIPIGPRMKEILSPFCVGREPDEFVFTNPKTETRFTRRPKLMRAICKRLGITPYGFHAIRHFITSYLYNEKDAGKTDLQKLLGHQTPTTTDIYINDLDDNLRGPVEKLDDLLEKKQVATGGGLTVFRPRPDVFSAN